MDAPLIAAAVVALIAIVSNVAVVICLARTTRELRKMRQLETDLQSENFWRESPFVDLERRS